MTNYHLKCDHLGSKLFLHYATTHPGLRDRKGVEPVQAILNIQKSLRIIDYLYGENCDMPQSIALDTLDVVDTSLLFWEMHTEWNIREFYRLFQTDVQPRFEAIGLKLQLSGTFFYLGDVSPEKLKALQILLIELPIRFTLALTS
jgi:hypothetical protein